MRLLLGHGASCVCSIGTAIAQVLLRTGRRVDACSILVMVFLLLSDRIATAWCARPKSQATCSYGGAFFETDSSPRPHPQCLVLTRDLSKEICGMQRADRIKMTRNVRLKFCSSYTLYSLISASDTARPCRVRGSHRDCHHCLDNLLLETDLAVQENISLFDDLLQRFDCDYQYSVKWNCNNCKVAYKNWLCANELPYFHSGQRVLPCTDDFCSRVEEKCPFFRPINDDTHVGDPSFICKASAISSVKNDLCYRQAPACYKLCSIQIDTHSENCHTINLTHCDVNQTSDVTVSTNSTSTALPLHSHRVFLLVDLVTCSLVAWVMQTILQYAAIGWT